jgi:hypothetical protein
VTLDSYRSSSEEALATVREALEGIAAPGYYASATTALDALAAEVEDLKLACDHWRMFNRKAEARAQAAETELERMKVEGEA